MARVLYPGSFDPFHNGHRELVETAAFLFDEVVVAAIRNPGKADGLFDVDERKAMITETLDHLDNVKVVGMAKLTVDVAQEEGADFIIKGLRAVSDFENEMAQAQTNLAVSGIHTLFLPSASANSFISSGYIRQFALFGADISSMVPDVVARRVKEKYAQ